MRSLPTGASSANSVPSASSRPVAPAGTVSAPLEPSTAIPPGSTRRPSASRRKSPRRVSSSLPSAPSTTKKPSPRTAACSGLSVGRSGAPVRSTVVPLGAAKASSPFSCAWKSTSSRRKPGVPALATLFAITSSAASPVAAPVNAT
jgi:hypothetical protein